jgi:hypothetical protein
VASNIDLLSSQSNKNETFSFDKISGSHGGEYEEDYLLGCCAV